MSIKIVLQTSTPSAKFCQLFTLSHHFALNFPNYLLYCYFYTYIEQLLSVSWKKFHFMEYFSGQFVTEHYINLSLVLNPLCNSFMCCQLLVLSIRPQYNLVIDSVLMYLFWLKQYQKFYATFHQSKMVLFLFFLYSGTHQLHDLVECHAASIISLFNSPKCFKLFIFITPTHKSNMIHVRLVAWCNEYKVSRLSSS